MSATLWLERQSRSVCSIRPQPPFLSPVDITFHARKALSGAASERFIATARHFRIDRAGGRSQSWPPFISGRDKECNLSKKLYIGNLPFTSTEEDLKEVFGRHGSVDSVAVITDRETGRPRGFAFVEMSEESAASDAIRALDGTDLGGRNIKVNEAQDKQRGGGGGGGNRY
jgi:hypothetical protein